MIFAKVDVAIYTHPKFVAAGFEASGYWVHALAYLRHHESSNGFLATELITVPLSGKKAQCRRLCERLVSVGLFSKVEGGYVLVQYGEKNETKADITLRKAAARERKARSRYRTAPPPDPPDEPAVTRPVTHDDNAPVTADATEGVTPPLSPEERSASRAPSRSSSSSCIGSVQLEAPAPRRPLPPSERALSGPAWLAAFTEGIAKQTGRPCTVGRMYLSTLERVVDHHAPTRDAPGACTWLREQAGAFAAKWDGQHPPKGLTPDGLERWLNEGRVGPPQFGKPRIVQLPAEEWKPDDWSDLGAEVITK